MDKATIPQSALSRSQLPLHKGAIFSTPIEFILVPEGSNGEGRKSVKKRAALLHVLAFSFLDHLFGVPKRALSEVAGTFFVSFLGVQKGRTNGHSPL